MNEGQDKFYHFILNRTKPEEAENAKELLNESFAKQDTGTFDSEYLMEFIPKMKAMLL